MVGFFNIYHPRDLLGLQAAILGEEKRSGIPEFKPPVGQ